LTHVVHLTASPFFGGPERQMIGLARSLPADHRSTFLSFAERGLCRPFVERLRADGFAAVKLRHNAPHFRAAIQEIADHLARARADVLCCHGYKADLLGWRAARRVGVPVVAVSRGWTAATLKVRLYEALDRLSLHAMDAVVCVSESQAAKVRRAGVPPHRVHVIRNAIDTDRFERPDPTYRQRLLALFPRPVRQVVGAAGRLSAEKGFGVLVEAAAEVLETEPDTGFALFGDGPLREVIDSRIGALGLRYYVLLPGFRADLDDFIAALDLMVLPSFTEGLPNVVLEAFAAQVPVVATAVGGTPEVVDDGVSGYLVPPGDPTALADRIRDVLRNDVRRQEMGRRGNGRVQADFTFAAQARHYERLFAELRPRNGKLWAKQPEVGSNA
jgi:glycosyltransferase involved in cell wall biosynthesis